MCLVLSEARKEPQMPWNWSYGWLPATMWELGTKLGVPWNRAISALNHQVISLAPGLCFKYLVHRWQLTPSPVALCFLAHSVMDSFKSSHTAALKEQASLPGWAGIVRQNDFSLPLPVSVKCGGHSDRN